MAGSERASSTGVSGARLVEANNINRSLSALGDVITAISDVKKKKFAPYRNSALTWLLKDSLGGNTKSTMLAAVSPNPAFYSETMSTLRYVERARYIVNYAKINENSSDTGAHILFLEQEVIRLKQALSASLRTIDANLASSMLSPQSEPLVPTPLTSTVPSASPSDCEEIKRLRLSFETELRAVDESVLDSLWDTTSQQANPPVSPEDFGITPIKGHHTGKNFNEDSSIIEFESMSVFDEIDRLTSENDYLSNELQIRQEEIHVLINEFCVPVSEQLSELQAKHSEVLVHLDACKNENMGLMEGRASMDLLLKLESNKAVTFFNENKRLKNAFSAKLVELDYKNELVTTLQATIKRKEEESLAREGIDESTIVVEEHLIMPTIDTHALIDVSEQSPSFMYMKDRNQSVDAADTTFQFCDVYLSNSTVDMDNMGVITAVDEIDNTCLDAFEPLFLHLKTVLSGTSASLSELEDDFNKYNYLRKTNSSLFDRLKILFTAALTSKEREVMNKDDSTTTEGQDSLSSEEMCSPSKRFVSYDTISQALVSSKLDLAVISTEYDRVVYELRQSEKLTCDLKLELAEAKGALDAYRVSPKKLQLQGSLSSHSNR